MTTPITEVLITPVSSMIREIGNSVAEAARDLNAAQLDLVENYPVALRQAGFIPTMYHMQTVEAELQMALHLEMSETKAGKARFFSAPMNARYKSAMEYTADGASKLKMTFAPGPLPTGLDEETSQ